MGEDTNGNGVNRAWIEAIRADLAERRSSLWAALGVAVTVLLAFGGLVANGLYKADADAREERHAIEADVERLMQDVAALQEQVRKNEARLDRIDP